MYTLNYRYQYASLAEVTAVETLHDVPNCGYKVTIDGEKLFYATDCGTLDGIEAKGYDYYAIENNHREEEIQERIRQKQAAGEFSYETRAAWTHLSEEKAIEWLAANAGENSRYVFLHQHKQD